MSILSTSPINARMFDAQIAAALGDVNAAIMCDSFIRNPRFEEGCMASVK